MGTPVFVPDLCIVYEMKMMESGRIVQADLFAWHNKSNIFAKSLDYFY